MGSTLSLDPTTLGLPHAISYRNAYWTWGTGDATGELLLIPADPEDEILEHFRVAEPVAEIDCPLCLSHVSRHVYLCSDPVRPLGELWPEPQEFR